MASEAGRTLADRTLAAVSILREHLPALKIRVVNVVNLMKLQPPSEHPHGLSDPEFDELFTTDKPVIFAFHGNDLDRFHLAMDTIDRLPHAGQKGGELKQRLRDKLIEHKEYIEQYGEDLPEIRNWKWHP